MTDHTRATEPTTENTEAEPTADADMADGTPSGPASTGRNSTRRNPNRRARRSRSRLAVTAALATGAVFGVGGVASADSASADSAAPRGDAWSSEAPRITVPTNRGSNDKVPGLDDYLVEGSISRELPESYGWPDDDADPEPADPGDNPPGVDPGRFIVDQDALGTLDPDDLEGILPDPQEGGGGPGGEDRLASNGEQGCDDPDFAAAYPQKCPDRETPGDTRDIPPEEPCETSGDDAPSDDASGDDATDGPDVEPGDECEQPDVTTTTTVPDETTTTVTERRRSEPGPDVGSEVATKGLAFTGSSVALPLVGVGLLGAGAVVAGISRASRRRTTGPGEA